MCTISDADIGRMSPRSQSCSLASVSGGLRASVSFTRGLMVRARTRSSVMCRDDCTKEQQRVDGAHRRLETWCRRTCLAAR